MPQASTKRYKMGNNAAYTYMEANVIAAYDAGLRGEQLAPFMEPYRGTDIDEGGRCDLTTRDGKDIDEVILSQFAPERYEALMARKPGDGLEDSTSYDEWRDEFDDAEYAITHGRFGWG
jgi:hypothetical protein